jgi:hypothetical protein
VAAFDVLRKTRFKAKMRRRKEHPIEIAITGVVEAPRDSIILLANDADNVNDSGSGPMYEVAVRFGIDSSILFPLRELARASSMVR